ncbi:ScbA/BarX family gamma-butyrolactone biosynthesis protein [Jatrophihabitans sp.]|uniref:ScbA/BarX family gamma-butyrolactone biosynthesis protein n=1 Tax=Jatrophihabitans sp. TaxID=1932789 RepID=UPI002BD4DBC3|nr:ScbA/BarX family gamma-butyrolactone biosynthesis protein [Jatrophihabitans sp.]
MPSATVIAAPPAEPAYAELSYDRTVDRTLLHRAALAEVFLTDARPVSPQRYLAAAQLPPAHRYYTDHLNGAAVLDPILLLECCRQAETLGGHQFCGVGDGQVFILKRWSMQLRDAGLPAQPAPACLRLDVRTSNARRVGPRLRAVTFTIDMSIGRQDVGTTRMDVAYLAAQDYLGRRRRPDGGLPPRSDEIPAPAPENLLPARAVGRELAANVLLAEPSRSGGQSSYLLRLAVDHPSMFDHPQDHVPGVVLTDAARQAGVHLLSASSGLDPAELALTGFAGTFSRYADLDRPTRVQARRSDSGPLAATVTLTQQGEQVCLLELDFARCQDGSAGPEHIR